MGTGSFPGGKERPGRDADPSPPSSAVGHERVELYLYSTYGPYGLYRASLPVQGCTLPLPLHLFPWPPQIFYTQVKVKVKVKLTLEQAVKGQRGYKGIALLFL